MSRPGQPGGTPLTGTRALDAGAEARRLLTDLVGRLEAGEPAPFGLVRDRELRQWWDANRESILEVAGE